MFKLGTEGNVFTSVCHSVHGGNGGLYRVECLHVVGLHPGGGLGRPSQYTMGYGQRSGGLRPSEIHSCYRFHLVLMDFYQ